MAQRENHSGICFKHIYGTHTDNLFSILSDVPYNGEYCTDRTEGNTDDSPAERNTLHDSCHDGHLLSGHTPCGWR